MRPFILLFALVAGLALASCRASTDLRDLGVGANAGWDNGPKFGADVSAGKHEVEISPPFGPGLSGEAAPPAPSSPPPAQAAPAPSPAPSTGGSGVPWLWIIVIVVLAGGGVWYFRRKPKAA